MLAYRQVGMKAEGGRCDSLRVQWSEVGAQDLDQMEDRAHWKGAGGYDMYAMPKGAC